MSHAAPHTHAADNPLLQDWQTPFGLPPFAAVQPTHFEPAFDAALAADRADVDAIANAVDAPTFANTYARLDQAGRLLSRVGALFGNLTSSETSPALQTVETKMAPRLAAHESATYLNGKLFTRLDAVFNARASLGLTVEQLRLVERVHLDFVLSGARLGPEAKARMAQINERLATLSTQFNQNVLADEGTFQLVLQSEADLAGLSASLRAAAKSAAEARGVADGWMVTLSRSLVVPFLTQSTRRDLREQVFKAWTRRGDNAGPTDNKPLAREILALRNEQARLMGHTNYADFALADRMAKRPQAVADLLARVWGPAKAKAAAECEALVGMARSLGHEIEIAPWDWRFYAEKVRAARYDFDESVIKPYFSLDAMLAAAMDCATRLFSITFHSRADLPVYHPDVQAFEVRDSAGAPMGVFLSDNFARATKRGGAWMSSYRSQSRHNGALPIISNNNNFAKAPVGEPTLLSFDDARTLFHEFGHGLHGLLSNVEFERLSGTAVLRDFVELPSQLYEHWLSEDEVLAKHARHYKTGEPIPQELIAKLKAARGFNQGFETVEYTSCALVDMALHAQTDPEGVDVAAFEAAELARIGMPREIVMRHRPPHFLHLFSGPYYAAGYYVYMWAEVLDADGFDAFTEAGSPFDGGVASRLLKYIYSTGNTVEPGEAYRAFRGRDPEVLPMLKKRGLIEA